MYIHPYFKEREVYMCIILMLQLYVVFICITKDILLFVGRGGGVMHALLYVLLSMFADT